MLKNTQTDNHGERLQGDEFYVSKQTAVLAARNFANKYQFQFSNLLNRKEVKHKERSYKTVKNVLVLGNEKNPALYLINYEDGGFVVVPADQRLNPILAYSEINIMPARKDEPIPGGLNIWLEEHVKIVDSLNTTKKKDQIGKHFGWIALSSPSSISKTKLPPPPGGSCEDEFEQVGPLLQTKWGQQEGYNNAMPAMNCSNNSFPSNGKAFTGCVATAMAQVMRYHQHSSNYNWSAMPNGPIYSWNQPSGTNDIAQLMRDIADNVNMEYKCNGSGANEDEIASSFISDFNYSTSTRKVTYEGTSNYDIVKQELRNNRPVIFTGYQKGKWFIFPVREGGHAWVSDGFKRSLFYQDGCSTAIGYLHFHMNWGWNDSNYDGWYAFNNFNPGDRTYNYKSSVIVGIKP